MKLITQENWDKTPKDYKGIWTIEREDIPNWNKIRTNYVGKKTLLTATANGTGLMVEGIHFKIVDKSPLTKEN
jgi:hypothetical protein